VGIRPSSIGVNYLELCDSARGDSAQGAREVARGIREVISDKMEEFVMDYPLMTSKGKRWFYMRAARLTGPEPMRLVISHEDVTPLKRAEEVCIRHETELEIQKRSLEEANTALKVLLKRGEEDRKELEEKVVSNVQQLVTTYVIKMKETSLDARQRQYMEIIESNLSEVVSPFARSLSSDFFHLTPKEIEVANLVKIGKTTKEIAEIMSSSASVINFHRKNIRKKMGINKKKINLQAYLMNI